MPHAALKLSPGTDTNKTPALNELAVSFTSNVRFTPDRDGLGLIQKVGGWTRYIAQSFVAPIRALKAWADLENTKYLAIGGEGAVGVQIYNPDTGGTGDVTPRYISDDITPDGTDYGFVTTAGSTSVALYTPVVSPEFSYVFFPTGINIGNVAISGPYQILTTGVDYYTFVVPDLLTPIASISTSNLTAPCTITVQFSFPHSFSVGDDIFVDGVNDTNYDDSYTITDVTETTIEFTKSSGSLTDLTSYGGTVGPDVQYGGTPPLYSVDGGKKTITVTFANHGLSVGSTFNAPIATTVGGIPIQGLYTVTKIVSTNQFKITSTVAATSTTTGYENGGDINAYTFVGVLTAEFTSNSVYGGGIYNEGVYSSGFSPIANNGVLLEAVDWSFDNWGSILIANPKNGAIYYWQPVGSNIANLSYAPNAPVYNTGCFVAMPQRQIIAYGSSFGTIQDPLLVRWCEVEDFSIWIGQANNQAGSYRIPTGSRIVGGLQASQQGLLWTDLDLWAMSYIGPPYVYGFNKVGANAGLIAQKAVGQMGGIVYWMSQKQFFRFAGNGVEPIACPVWDQVFQNLYPGVDENGNPYTDRIRCAANSQFTEIVWYYPAHYTYDIDPASGLSIGEGHLGNGEVNAYVKYNVALNQWDYGYQDADNLDVVTGRTAWIDQSILGPPIGAGVDNSGVSPAYYVYQHETSNDADGHPLICGFTTGYANISDADNMIFLDQVWPDMKWGFVDQAKAAQVNVTFYVTNYPGDPPRTYGPYPVTQETQYLSVRMRGRYVAISLSSDDLGSFWRIGSMRYRYQPDGRY